MQKAALPDNEALRLQSLKSFNILDTEAEARYDELTALAATICDVPMCLISLIDEDRQWFKSHHGLGATQTPREVAFCSHAILGDGIMEINDSRQDERFDLAPTLHQRMQADANRLHQVLNHLIIRAADISHGDKVCIQAKLVEQASDSDEINVIDRGAIISADICPNLFP
jgi:signal transduction histidine kinase